MCGRIKVAINSPCNRNENSVTFGMSVLIVLKLLLWCGWGYGDYLINLARWRNFIRVVLIGRAKHDLDTNNN